MKWKAVFVVNSSRLFKLQVINIIDFSRKVIYLIWFRREICRDQALSKTDIFFFFTSTNIDYGLVFWTLTDGLESCGLLWCFYQLLNILTAPFTPEDPLVSKWCNAKFLHPFWWRNKFIYISDGLRVSTFSGNFHFWVSYSFKRSQSNHLNIKYISSLTNSVTNGLCMLMCAVLLLLLLNVWHET